MYRGQGFVVYTSDSQKEIRGVLLGISGVLYCSLQKWLRYKYINIIKKVI